MTQTLIDGASMTGNESVSGTFVPADPGLGYSLVLYVEGDGSATNLTINYHVAAQDDTATFYELPGGSEDSVDLTATDNNRQAFEPPTSLRGAGAIKVIVDDNRAGGSTETIVTVRLDQYDES